MNRFSLRLSYHWRSLLLNKTIDILIVIIGVTIAFQLSNVKQRYDQKSLESFYLESLVADIDNDISSIEHILRELRADSTLTNLCLSGHALGTLSLDTIGATVVNILSFETFNYRNDNTYNAMMNSHGLSIISDRSARNLISEYYRSYKSVDRFEYVYTEFLLHDFHPYFKSFVDYTTGEVIDSSILNNISTNNAFVIAGEQLNDGIWTYKNMLSRASELRRTLVKL